MIVVTTDRVGGKRVVRTLGLVRGNTIRARHVGKDIMAALRNLVGGELEEYTKLLAESREQALDRMIEEAKGLGANGIISTRFSTSMIMASAAELLAYGTAVVLENGDTAPDCPSVSRFRVRAKAVCKIGRFGSRRFLCSRQCHRDQLRRSLQCGGRHDDVLLTIQPLPGPVSEAGSVIQPSAY